ncbi:MAG TPA: carotenoid oxygenase family protein, partial [Trichocoleus sp.]
SLIRTGPGTFEVGKQSYRHWFDGLAMLRKFSFEDGRVLFANRFLKSRAYQEARAKGKISRSEFGTVARNSLFERLRDPLPRVTDNATVNITVQGNQTVSVTESPMPIGFDPKTLTTLEQLDYKDHVRGQITTAHPHFDFEQKALFSYLVDLVPRCSYNIYRMDPDSQRRERVGSVPIKRPAYMHTFAMTEHYIVLSEFPLFLDRLSLLFGCKPIIENYRWQPEEGTRFLVISKADGKVVHSCKSASFFAFHHVNAFEQAGEVVVDLVAYPDPAVIQSLYLEPLLHHPEQVIAAGELRRYRIPLDSPTAAYEVLSPEPIELPRINYRRCNARDYQFAYGVGNSKPGNFIDQLVKVNVQDGSAQIWRSQDCYPGEPVFVAAPDAVTEDAGVVLSVVLQVPTENSFLLVLDGQSFEELARVELPYALPFDFHGQYFSALEPTQLAHLHR